MSRVPLSNSGCFAGAAFLAVLGICAVGLGHEILLYSSNNGAGVLPTDTTQPPIAGQTVEAPLRLTATSTPRRPGFNGRKAQAPVESCFTVHKGDTISGILERKKVTSSGTILIIGLDGSVQFECIKNGESLVCPDGKAQTIQKGYEVCPKQEPETP